MPDSDRGDGGAVAAVAVSVSIADHHVGILVVTCTRAPTYRTCRVQYIVHSMYTVDTFNVGWGHSLGGAERKRNRYGNRCIYVPCSVPSNAVED